MPLFTTGPTTLPDIGVLAYNGCTFGPLLESSVSGEIVKDNAGRTTKTMKYVITVDGYVTLPDGQVSVNGVMATLRRLLTAQAGTLTYRGRGMDIVVNQAGSATQDVQWGPIPELLDFTPLGAGRSAKITWKVTTYIPEIAPVGGRLGPVLQFNQDTAVTYDDAGYSTLSIRGTLEIPLTRSAQNVRTLTRTVDDFRQSFMTSIADGIDLTRFRIVRREFPVSRDKRTMEWDFAAEELPYMGLPPNITVARGNFDFHPASAGMGLCNWLCTLRVTYTVPMGQPRRLAWLAFLALLRVRMAQSVNGVVPPPSGNQNPGIVGSLVTFTLAPVNTGLAPLTLANNIINSQNTQVSNSKKAWLTDFRGSEGIYLDSRTVTFAATWKLVTAFSAILVASGIWHKVPSDGGNTWATSVRDISGWTSWLSNRLNAGQDAIVDFGG